jgi:hypothetical protein
MTNVLRWLSVALVASFCLSASQAAAQQSDVPPPPPSQAPLIIVQPQPQPQTVYVQPSPQYGSPVYAQPSPYMDPAPAQRGGPRNLGLIISGAVILGVGWVFNIITSLFAGVHVDLFGSGSGGSSDAWEAFRYTGLIPVVGPWIQMALQPTSFGNDGWGPYLIIDGLLQAAGLTMLVIGVATQGGDEDTAENDDGIELTILPSVSPGFAGLTALGRF